MHFELVQPSIEYKNQYEKMMGKFWRQIESWSITAILLFAETHCIL